MRMNLEALVRARKQIYRLEESPRPSAATLLRAILELYCLIDRAFLRRSSRADTRSEKLLSPDRKFLCVLVPKSGSRTIINGLRTAAARQRFKLLILESPIDDFVQRRPDDFTTFAFVRDPWARVYSCYVQKIQQWTPIKAALHANGRRGLHQGMSFGDFIRWLNTSEGSDAVADRHWISQTRVLGLDQGVQYDFIGHLERMDADLELIMGRLGVDADVFEHRLRTSEPGEYLRHYTPELVALVADRYRGDIRAFGYVPPAV